MSCGFIVDALVCGIASTSMFSSFLPEVVAIILTGAVMTGFVYVAGELYEGWKLAAFFLGLGVIFFIPSKGPYNPWNASFLIGLLLLGSYYLKKYKDFKLLPVIVVPFITLVCLVLHFVC